MGVLASYDLVYEEQISAATDVSDDGEKDDDYPPSEAESEPYSDVPMMGV